MDGFVLAATGRVAVAAMDNVGLTAHGQKRPALPALPLRPHI